MSLIAVASAKFSPGASTFAELLMLLRPEARAALLVDCDPAGGEWLLRPGVQAEPGLVTLAMAGRRELAPHAALDHAQTVGEGLDVVVAPAAARQASSALSILAERLGAHLCGLDDIDVVADCGRLATGSPALGVAAAADLVVLVSRPSVVAMVHLAPWVEQLASEGRPVGVVLVDRHQRHTLAYGPDEVAEALGVPVFGMVADDPGGATRLFAQPGSLHGLLRTRLIRSERPVVDAVWGSLAGPGQRPVAAMPPVEEVATR